MPTQKEAIENLVKILKKWQIVEDDSIKNTTEIIKKSDNPLVHLVMEIIRQDSVMHRRVQQLIIDHFEKKPITLNPDELVDFWSMVEEHDEIEKKTIQMAEEALAQQTSPFAKYLLEYLLTDEKKHDKLLEEMEKIKKGMYPYGGM
jgi:rubrerythrin